MSSIQCPDCGESLFLGDIRVIDSMGNHRCIDCFNRQICTGTDEKLKNLCGVGAGGGYC